MICKLHSALTLIGVSAVSALTGCIAARSGTGLSTTRLEAYVDNEIVHVVGWIGGVSELAQFGVSIVDARDEGGRKLECIQFAYFNAKGNRFDLQFRKGQSVGRAISVDLILWSPSGATRRTEKLNLVAREVAPYEIRSYGFGALNPTEALNARPFPPFEATIHHPKPG